MTSFIFVGLLVSLLVVMAGLSIWMCLKIWRSNPILAIACFFISPLILVALVIYWRDPKSDIRLLFFTQTALLISFIVALFIAGGIEGLQTSFEPKARPSMSSSTTATFENSPPHAVKHVEQTPTDLASEAPEIEPPSVNEIAADSAVETPAISSAEAEAQQRAELEMAVKVLSWRFGIIDLAPVKARLSLPRDFKFVPRSQVFRVARLRGTPVNNDVVGWVVHRQVDLSRDDAWYVQIRYVPTSLKLSNPRTYGEESVDNQNYLRFVGQIASVLNSDSRKVYHGQWHGQFATWQLHNALASNTHRDHFAAKLIDGGILEFSVPALHEVHSELGSRSVRLIASKTTTLN